MGCRGPAAPEALVVLRTEYGVVYGTSTESGILVLSPLAESREELSFRYFVRTGAFDDVAVVDRRGPWLSVLKPSTSRPNEARFAVRPPDAEELLYLETRDADGAPILLEASLLDEGGRGDFLVLDSDQDAERLAGGLAGCGVYVLREGYLQLAGVLNGIYLDSPEALAFIGLEEIARILPESSSYYERRVQARRADFEYGIPRDFRGEQIRASGVESVPARETQPIPPTPMPGIEGEDEDLGSLLRVLEDDGSGSIPD